MGATRENQVVIMVFIYDYTAVVAATPTGTVPHSLRADSPQRYGCIILPGSFLPVGEGPPKTRGCRRFSLL